MTARRNRLLPPTTARLLDFTPVRPIRCVDATSLFHVDMPFYGLFQSQHELILRGGDERCAWLSRVNNWDQLRAYLTVSSSSCNLTALWIDSPSDWNAVCRTLQSPNLRLTTVGFRSVALTDDDVATVVAFLRSHTDEKLRLRNISFEFTELSACAAERIAEAFQGSDCQLEGLDIHMCDSCEDRAGEKLALGFAKALREAKCNMQRLGFSRWDISDEGAAILFQALRSNACKLSELFLCGRGSNLSVKGVRSLTEALRDATCPLQRLAIEFGDNSDEAMSTLAAALQSEDCKLVDIWLRFSNSIIGTSYIAGALRSSRCKLEKLRIDSIADLQLLHPELLVDALQKNLRLTSLWVRPSLPPALRVRCDALLKRNRRLKDGELLVQRQTKPHTAKLFICGHEQVGKTTVRKSLRRAKRGIRTINPRDILVKEPRTRGMEFERFSFAKGSLVVCDLAGQKEYHAFHHYFVNGSDKDLFLIVCKVNENESESTWQQDFELQLRYWLRFILSHHTPGMSPPKVIILVNFFHSRDGTERLSREATEKTQRLVAQYHNDLDFGMTRETTNIFGIHAKKVRHLTPILTKLELLLEELLDSRPQIPSLCDELVSMIFEPSNKLKSFWQSVIRREVSPYLPVAHIVNKYYEQFCGDRRRPCPLLKTFNAALVELHNSGQIIYFQSDNKSEEEEEIVIADCGWFCHNLIGALLEPKELRRSSQDGRNWIWRKEDVLKILRQHQQHANKQQLDQVLSYLQCLELVYPIHEGDMNSTSMESELLFPALLSEKVVNWPERSPTEAWAFLGRRLECEDKHKTLLPSGVFTRLQAKLHSAYLGNMSYKVGHGWISFVEDNVTTIVRFAGDTDLMEDCQWIDVLVSWLKSDEENEFRAEKIFCNVKTQILKICHEGDRGCQGVVLQENAVKENDVRQLTQSSSMERVSLEALKREKRGIACAYSWSDQTCTAIADLFLPRELEELFCQDNRAIRRIAEEFQINSEETFISSLKQPDKSSLGAPSTSTPLRGESEALLKRFEDVLERKDARDEVRYQNTMEALMYLRKDIRSLTERIGQMEKSILSSCADKVLRELRLVTDHLNGPVPAFLYFTDKHGVWHTLKGLVKKEVQLHIMCEWHAGPHPIDDQEGVPVKMSSSDWLIRAAPVLIPALKLFCCAAKLAASIYLPGAQVFIPSPGSLDVFGLSGEMIQQHLLPDVLKKFVSGVSSIEIIEATKQDLNESKLRELLSSLLKGKTINMEKDFNLHRVQFDDRGRILWVCEKHSIGQTLLKNINPFL